MSDTAIETPIISTPSEDSPVTNNSTHPTSSSGATSKELTRICVLNIDALDEVQEEPLAEGVKFKRVYKVMKCEGEKDYVEACEGAGQMRPKKNKLMLLDDIFEWKLAAQILMDEKCMGIKDQKRIAIINLTEFPYITTHIDYRDQKEILGAAFNDEAFLSQVMTYVNADECRSQWICTLIINSNISHATFRLLNGGVCDLFNLYKL